ncbi:trimeric intracellular cation channel family protein [Corynebacterium tapiri]|uniref:Trimeric intracellular cation channel family protein n=1 Tax=Corynebacterium tapiri TaxID=1448266 RepID=A0A5C4U5W5_9CORY|nr:trimeric intracellular cation channel family protein [Corynebacterium tapiri]TNL98786.1 trimeric intracellular cation channel family protein [Corynebacterium tapiri]
MQGEVPVPVEQLYRLIDVSGVFLMGVVGGRIARQKDYDIVGFFFLALFSALGGGMIRDTLIQAGAPAAVAEREYLMLAFAGAMIAWLTRFQGPLWDKLEAHADAIISASWAVTGATKALNFGMPLLSALFMGVLTATGGGMIRDVVTGERPRVFGGNGLAVIPAVLAGLICAVFHHAHLQFIGMILGLLVGAGLSIASYWFGWQMHRDPDFAPVNMTARQVYSLLSRAKNRLVRRNQRPVDEIIEDMRSGEDVSEELHEVQTAQDYSFEDVLRALHSDDSDAGRENERAFIEAWLSWKKEQAEKQG